MRQEYIKEHPSYPPEEDQFFPLLRTPPSWPAGRRKSGKVVFEFTVGTDGRPKDITVVESSGSRYERAAIRTLRKWRYCPSFKDGEPIESQAKLTLRFARD